LKGLRRCLSESMIRRWYRHGTLTWFWRDWDSQEQSSCSWVELIHGTLTWFWRDWDSNKISVGGCMFSKHPTEHWPDFEGIETRRCRFVKRRRFFTRNIDLILKGLRLFLLTGLLQQLNPLHGTLTWFWRDWDSDDSCAFGVGGCAFHGTLTWFWRDWDLCGAVARSLGRNISRNIDLILKGLRPAIDLLPRAQPSSESHGTLTWFWRDWDPF